MRLVVPVVKCRNIKSTALVAALCFFASGVNADDIVRVSHDGFTVVHMSSLPDPAVELVTDQVERAIKEVSGWLAQADSWQNPMKVERIRVLIDPDSHTPTQQRTTIFVPEGRLRRAFSESALDQADLGIVHEITHVLAESAYRQDRNRFYDDGLAVYLQQKFGPRSNYPSFGPDLHVATAALAAESGALLPLNECDQARRVTDDSVKRRLAYLQLGSFTQFLIENYGVGAYFALYGGTSSETTTGHSLDDLELRWQALINSIQ